VHLSSKKKEIRDLCTEPHDETFVDKEVTVFCCLLNAMPSVVPPTYIPTNK
jgi:hypothetical protein